MLRHLCSSQTGRNSDYLQNLERPSVPSPLIAVDVPSVWFFVLPVPAVGFEAIDVVGIGVPERTTALNPVETPEKSDLNFKQMVVVGDVIGPQTLLVELHLKRKYTKLE